MTPMIGRIEEEIGDNAARWSFMLTFLTLDVVFEVSEHLELRVEDPVSLIRQSLRESWRQHARDSSEGIRTGDDWAVQAVRTLEHLSGDLVAKEAVRWCKEVFWPALYDMPRYGYWTALLLQARFNESFRDSLQLPRERTDDVWQHLAESYDLSGFDDFIDQWKCSPWDARIRFSRMMVGDDGDDGVVEVLKAVARVALQRRFWSWLCGSLSDSELDAFQQSAQGLAHRERSLAFIDELARPSDLAIKDTEESRDEDERD